MFLRSILSPDLGKAIQQLARMETIPLHVVPDQGCGASTRRKKLICRLLHVKKAEKPRLIRFQTGSQNGNKRSLVEQSYNRFVLLCDLTTSTPFCILTRDAGETSKLLGTHLQHFKIGSVVCISQPYGCGQLQRCSTKIVGSFDPITPAQLAPDAEPETTCLPSGVTENYHYTMLRGCQIQLHRVGMSAESVCEGILCDGQYKVCGCVSGAKSTKWTLTIVISADKLKQYDEFTITSNYVTELFVTAAARSVKGCPKLILISFLSDQGDSVGYVRSGGSG